MCPANKKTLRQIDVYLLHHFCFRIQQRHHAQDYSTMLLTLMSASIRLLLLLSALTSRHAAADDSTAEVTVVIIEEEPAGTEVINLSSHEVVAEIIAGSEVSEVK